MDNNLILLLRYILVHLLVLSSVRSIQTPFLTFITHILLQTHVLRKYEHIYCLRFYFYILNCLPIENNSLIGRRSFIINLKRKSRAERGQEYLKCSKKFHVLKIDRIHTQGMEDGVILINTIFLMQMSWMYHKKNPWLYNKKTSMNLLR